MPHLRISSSRLAAGVARLGLESEEMKKAIALAAIPVFCFTTAACNTYLTAQESPYAEGFPPPVPSSKAVGSVQMAVFSEEDVRAGKPVTDKVRLHQVVTQLQDTDDKSGASGK